MCPVNIKYYWCRLITINLQGLILFSDTFVKLLIGVSGLTEEQEKKGYNVLAPQVQRQTHFQNLKKKGHFKGRVSCLCRLITVNLQVLILFSDTFVKLLISVSGLTEEQEKKVYNVLALQVQLFVESRDYSSKLRKGVTALIDFINEAYDVILRAVNMGSLEIIVDCPTLRSLEHLWNDYLSGHLNKVAERYLVTDELKKKVAVKTINLKTNIDEENYMACSKFLTKMPGACSCKCLIMTKTNKRV